MKKTNSKLEAKLFAQYQTLIPAVISEFDGVAEVNLLPVAKDALKGAITEKLGALNAESVAKAIRKAVSLYLLEKQRVETVSLEDPVYGSSYNPDKPVPTIASTIRDRAPDPEEIAYLQEAVSRAEKMVERIPMPMKRVVQMRLLYPYYGYPEKPTDKEITSETGLTQEEISRYTRGYLNWLERVCSKR